MPVCRQATEFGKQNGPEALCFDAQAKSLHFGQSAFQSSAASPGRPVVEQHDIAWPKPFQHTGRKAAHAAVTHIPPTTGKIDGRKMLPRERLGIGRHVDAHRWPEESRLHAKT